MARAPPGAGEAASSEAARVAVKLVDASGWDATQYDEFYRECFLLAQIDHPNIVELIAVYKNARARADGSARVEFAMVTELCTGGELFDRIQRVGRFSERAAARVCRRMLGALRYLHARGIAHRDIKPENVVYASGVKGAEVKLIDFGFAQMRDVADARFATRLGSPNYVAPEILLGKRYDERCDIWSLGVMLFVMLCGSFPFSADCATDAAGNPTGERMSQDEANMAVYRKIVHGAVYWVEAEWAHVSPPARQLVASMLTVDFTRRPSAEECLCHPWVADRTVPLRESFPEASRAAFGRFNAARHSSRFCGYGGTAATAAGVNMQRRGGDEPPVAMVPSSAGRHGETPRERFVRAARVATAAARVCRATPHSPSPTRADMGDIVLLAMAATRRSAAALPGGLLRALTAHAAAPAMQDYFSCMETESEASESEASRRRSHRRMAYYFSGSSAVTPRSVRPNKKACDSESPMDVHPSVVGAKVTHAEANRPVLTERPERGGHSGGGGGALGRAWRGLRRAAGRPRERD